MAKVDLELVKMILQRNELDVRTVSQIVEDIETEAKAMEDENPKLPPVKKQFVFMISDPKGELPDKDFTGWVLQIQEQDSPYVVEERLQGSAYDFNVTPKGRKMPVRSIAEVCEVVPARILTEHSIWVKTKEPVYVLKTDNKISSAAHEPGIQF
ncbi:MAG: hypothetical protein JW739_05765 [Opitutales bacterium]|nr:hypothetical protein [Opitutales bacterium]